MNPIRRPLAVLLLAIALPVLAQKETEIFVPIGESPGVSGKLTLVAALGPVDAAARTLRMGNLPIRIDDRTRIWIDRSKLRQSNGVGTMADLTTGALAEVRFRGDNASAAVADWIKVQPAAP
jgi:hypothetical protein